MIETIEGYFKQDGTWQAAEGSPFRSLTAQEVTDLRQMAETTTPIFGGPDNAPWEGHHPLAREVWESRGLKPKE